MSHFTVIVIGDKAEEQLEPYSEFECTGEENKYVQTIDTTDEYLKEYKEDNDYKDKSFEYFLDEYYELPKVTDLADLDIENEHKYGYYTVIDGVTKSYRRTNPNKKWDWYQLGGRWTGFFDLKKGSKGLTGETGLFGKPAAVGTTDSALKKDIDFEKMKSDAALKADEDYDYFSSLMQGLEFPKTWPECIADFTVDGKPDYDAARTLYNSQPAVIKIQSDEQYRSWFGSCVFDVFGQDKQSYINKCANGSFSPYAVVKDGQWYSKGDMGWWGMSSNEISQEEWNQKVAEMINALDDDVLISLYDCHI